MPNVDEYIFRFVGKDDVTGTMRRIGTGSKATEKSVRGIQDQVNGVRTGLGAMAREIPGVNMMFNSMLSPVALVGAGVGLITKELHDSSVAANKFNSEFRELQNLNLGKTSAELSTLKFDVLQTAGDKAFDPYKTSTAFYDVQSITGMYGKEVQNLVSKQGEFARLMNADFNQYITGTGKAMANYGFGTEQLDAYNRSAYATVKVGSITFEQLAKNQAVYAGYAASANQSFESANKLMTLFTLKTKSSEESATLVKSAFTDLFKPEVIKSFEAAGVQMFDPITNNARQVDDILLDLNKRFSMVEGQKAINDLRNTFKGSEGLISLIQIATDQTGNLQRSLSDMDNARANIDDAKSIFDKDVTSLKELNRQLREGNRIMRGERMSGVAYYFQSRVNEVRKSINTGLRADLLLEEKNPEGKEYKKAFSEASHFATNTYGDDKDLSRINERIAELNNPLPMPSWKDYLKDESSEYKVKPKETYTTEFINSLGLNEVQLSVYNKDLTQLATSMYSGHTKGAKAGELQGLYDLRDNWGKPKPEVEQTTPDPLKNEETDNTISTISGGGVQHKNITISIDRVIDELKIESKTLPEGIADMEEQVKRAMVRVLQGTEQTTLQ